jgi:hypothetical protein
MIPLDTNVVSEPLHPAPDARVADWIDAQALDTLFLSAITVAELRAGLALLPAGKRRTGLHESLEARVLPLFSGRVLPFDLGCTRVHAQQMAKARAAGLALASADGYIAAIAVANRLTMATRDTGLFQAAGIAAINPRHAWRGSWRSPEVVRLDGPGDVPRPLT